MPKRSSTPASMPEASATGMRESIRSNRPENPAMAVSTAASTNAPMASDSGRPAVTPINIAAPGVDHAVTTGTFQRSDRPMHVRPMPMPSAHIHDAACASLAPSVRAAPNTITAELANPTSTVTKPAANADREWSRRGDAVAATGSGLLMFSGCTQWSRFDHNQAADREKRGKQGHVTSGCNHGSATHQSCTDRLRERATNRHAPARSR